MLELFFKDPFAILTTVLVLGMISFIAILISKSHKISKWGRFIIIFIFVGTAISALSATRDAYMTETALFSTSSLQSTVCSIAGGLIVLCGLIAIFIRNQKFRKINFYLISGFFLVQVITIEASRIVMKLVDIA